MLLKPPLCQKDEGQEREKLLMCSSFHFNYILSFRFPPHSNTRCPIPIIWQSKNVINSFMLTFLPFNFDRFQLNWASTSFAALWLLMCHLLHIKWCLLLQLLAHRPLHILRLPYHIHGRLQGEGRHSWPSLRQRRPVHLWCIIFVHNHSCGSASKVLWCRTRLFLLLLSVLFGGNMHSGCICLCSFSSVPKMKKDNFHLTAGDVDDRANLDLVLGQHLHDTPKWGEIYLSQSHALHSSCHWVGLATRSR